MHRFLTAVLMAGCLYPGTSFAWGRLAHEIVGRLAEKQLTPPAISATRRLLHGHGLGESEVASWADDLVKKVPATARWHYVNVPRGSGSYDPDRDCPRGDCVIAKIEEYLKKLGDKDEPDAARADALRFVVHFVADAQQPLHCINDDDHGGNDVSVTYHGDDMTLHGLWDAELIREDMGRRSLPEFEKQMQRDMTNSLRDRFSQGDLRQWVMQCHAKGELIYDALNIPSGPADIKVPNSYGPKEAGDVELDLEIAAIRLAALLNKALADEAVSSTHNSSTHRHRR